MPVQELIDNLVKVGEGYPEKTNSVFKIWDKHDNQPAANQLKSIKDKIKNNVPEKLQEVQLLVALVKILSLQDFVSSTQLMTGVKKELSLYSSFDSLDKYLPDTCNNKECPKITELRDAINGLGIFLHLEYETEKSVNKTTTDQKSINEAEKKEFQKLVDKFVEIGEKYPEQPPTVMDRLWGSGKHDNQSAAMQLKSIKSKLNNTVPVKLQEVQLLVALINMLNSKDLKSSTLLITDIKKELSAYQPFHSLDKYLPETCAYIECPKITELRDALTGLGIILHLEYETEKSVEQALKGAMPAHEEEQKLQKLADKIAQIGEKYPEQPPTVLDRLWGSGKHDNQLAANQLKSIKAKILNNIPEKLQKVQLLLALIKISNLKDFKYSTLLITDIKKELAVFDDFYHIDKYLPKTCVNKECPKITELREALTSLGFKLHLEYETEKSECEVEAKREKISTI